MRIITLNASTAGWCIDYQVLSPGSQASAQCADILQARRFANHAPLVMDCDLTSP